MWLPRETTNNNSSTEKKIFLPNEASKPWLSELQDEGEKERRGREWEDDGDGYDEDGEEEEEVGAAQGLACLLKAKRANIEEERSSHRNKNSI